MIVRLSLSLALVIACASPALAQSGRKKDKDGSKKADNEKGEPESPAISGARALLIRVTKRYIAYQDYQCKIRRTVRLDGQEPTESVVVFKFRSDKAYYTSSEYFGNTLECFFDGKTGNSYNAKNKVYGPLPEGPGCPNANAIYGLLTGDREAILSSSKKAKVKNVTIDGKVCRRLLAVAKSGEKVVADFSIEGELLRMKTLDSRKAITTYVFEEVKVDQGLPLSDFRLRPPVGTREVKAFGQVAFQGLKPNPGPAPVKPAKPKMPKPR